MSESSPSGLSEAMQAVWNQACADFDHAEILLKAAVASPEASRDVIKRREAQLRTRKAILNTINLVINNRAEIETIIARKRMNAS